MKENKLIKLATDKQLPDLEAIRNNCINQTKQDSKPKVLHIRPTKLLAVALISVVAVTSIVAFATQRPGIFAPAEAPTEIIETNAEILATKPQAKKSAKSSSAEQKTESMAASSSANNYSVEPEQKTEEIKSTGAERCITRMENAGISVNWLKDLGKTEGYHLCYAGTDESAAYNCRYIIGNYTFESDVQHSPYGLGLFIVGHEETFTLAEAYENYIITDFDAVIRLIDEYEEEDLGFTVYENDGTSTLFREYFDFADSVVLADLGSADDYELFYRLTADSADVEPYDVTLDGYTLTINEPQNGYGPGLYIEYEDTVCTLEDAYEAGIIQDMDDIAELVLGCPETHIDFRQANDESTPVEDELTEPEESEYIDE